MNLSEYLEKEECLIKNDTFIERNTNKKKSNTRSEELYNNRKKLILLTIFDYLTITPPVSMEFFIKKKNFKKSLEIFPQNIITHPFLPKSMKQIFEPMTR